MLHNVDSDVCLTKTSRLLLTLIYGRNLKEFRRGTVPIDVICHLSTAPVDTEILGILAPRFDHVSEKCHCMAVATVHWNSVLVYADM